MDVKIDNGNQKLGTITISGELNGENIPVLSKQISQLMEQGILFIILDFSEMHFISSLGVGTIVDSAELLSEKNGSMALVCRTPRLLKEFEQMHLDEIVDIFEDLDGAVSAIEKKQLL